MMERHHHQVSDAKVSVYRNPLILASGRLVMQKTESPEFAIPESDDRFMNLVEESTLSLVWLPRREEIKETKGKETAQ